MAQVPSYAPSSSNERSKLELPNLVTVQFGHHLNYDQAFACGHRHFRGAHMKQYILAEFSIRSIAPIPLVTMGNTMPPRDPDEDEEEEDDEGDDDEEDDSADEPPVVREPDED
jgi:hypothetical protein